jgi:hypothetical protein
MEENLEVSFGTVHALARVKDLAYHRLDPIYFPSLS